MASPIIIPQNTIGQPILVMTGGYALVTGQTATVIFKQSPGGYNTQLETAEFELTFSNGATQGTFTTSTGTEFTNVPGICDAQLKVTAGGLLLYSYVFSQYVEIQPPLG